eukprot:TRINITY_DN1324_c0_g1_i2.p1 TRINITY_DN1324_c0_g1~~TRINITY_DN1324_c0_g1_i2.p1  ORF type:complete len:330 (-),score=82.17 TRINITY_DN1324_c0_g1_i2:54-1043(-)
MSGLVEGYNACCTPGEELSYTDFIMLNAHNDIAAVLPACGFRGAPSKAMFTAKFTGEEFLTVQISAPLFNASVLPASSDARLLRMQKHYRLQFAEAAPIGKVSFTSYPGMIHSPDGYYLSESGLVVAQLPLDYSAGQEQAAALAGRGVPSFVRDLLAARYATSPTAWVLLHSPAPFDLLPPRKWLLYTAGLRRFTFPDGFLTLIEEAPGTGTAASASADITPYLRDHGVFSSCAAPQLLGVDARLTVCAVPHAAEWWDSVATADQALSWARLVLREMQAVDAVPLALDGVVMSSVDEVKSGKTEFLSLPANTPNGTAVLWRDKWLPTST